jgi:hypothetical protein
MGKNAYISFMDLSIPCLSVREYVPIARFPPIVKSGETLRPSGTIASLRSDRSHAGNRPIACLSKKVNFLTRSEGLGVNRETYFEVTMPEALLSVARARNLTFDDIIVDEGQDFETGWLQVLNALLTDEEEGVFYIFYDDNQRMYTEAKIPFRPSSCFQLIVGCRAKSSATATSSGCLLTTTSNPTAETEEIRKTTVARSIASCSRGETPSW